MVFGGRVLLVGRRSVAAAHRRCGERGSRAGSAGWTACLSGLRVAGRAARSCAAATGSCRWWRSGRAVVAASASGAVLWLRGVAFAVAVRVLVPAPGRGRGDRSGVVVGCGRSGVQADRGGAGVAGVDRSWLAAPWAVFGGGDPPALHSLGVRAGPGGRLRPSGGFRASRRGGRGRPLRTGGVVEFGTRFTVAAGERVDGRRVVVHQLPLVAAAVSGDCVRLPGPLLLEG